jgi:acetolactate synthase-1/2/3 large subunit
VKIILFNNGYLGMVRQQQEVQYKGNLVAVDLASGPDYVKLADAYGITAWCVDDPSRVEEALEAAMAHPGPAFVELRVSRDENVYPWVLGGASLGEVLPDTPYVPPTGAPTKNGQAHAKPALTGSAADR